MKNTNSKKWTKKDIIITITAVILIKAFVIGIGYANADTYYGEYSGQDNGNWAMYYDTVDPSRSFGVSWSDDYSILDFSYSIIMVGNEITMYATGGSTVIGSISDTGDVAGTWSNGDLSGTIEGNKIDSDDLTTFQGNYNLETDYSGTFKFSYTSNELISGTYRLPSSTVMLLTGIMMPDGNIFLRIPGMNVGSFGSRTSGNCYNADTGESDVYRTEGTTPTVNNDNNGYKDDSGCFITSM